MLYPRRVALIRDVLIVGRAERILEQVRLGVIVPHAVGPRPTVSPPVVLLAETVAVTVAKETPPHVPLNLPRHARGSAHRLSVCGCIGEAQPHTALDTPTRNICGCSAGTHYTPQILGLISHAYIPGVRLGARNMYRLVVESSHLHLLGVQLDTAIGIVLKGLEIRAVGAVCLHTRM